MERKKERKKKNPWWIFIVIIVFGAIYTHITYQLDHNHIYGDDLDTMLMLAGMLVVPFFASMFAAFKAPDKNNRTIYGLFAFGYFCMAFFCIIAIWTRFLFIEILFSMSIVMFFLLTWYGTCSSSRNQKKLKTKRQKQFQL